MSKKADHHSVYDSESEGFYSRWSKRKILDSSGQLTENQSELPTDLNSSYADAADKPDSHESNQETVLLYDKDMPDLDTLDEDSDYSGFLSPGVSEKLRKLALRKLFQGQSFNLCDGLDDYDEEFTSFEKLGDIITADMRFQIEEEARRKLQAASENDEVSADSDAVTLSDNSSAEDEIDESLLSASVHETTEIDEHDGSGIEQEKLPDNQNLS